MPGFGLENSFSHCGLAIRLAHVFGFSSVFVLVSLDGIVFFLLVFMDVMLFIFVCVD